MSFSQTATDAYVSILAAPPSVGGGIAPPGSDKITTLISWGAWLFFAFCVCGVLMASGKMIADHQRGGGGGDGATKLTWTLIATIVGATASALVGAFV